MLLSNILSVYYCMWTIYVNITILRKYSGNGRACASSRYQAVFFLPHGLGTGLSGTPHVVVGTLKISLDRLKKIKKTQEGF